jgi:hypothetical protein
MHYVTRFTEELLKSDPPSVAKKALPSNPATANKKAPAKSAARKKSPPR